MNTKPWSRATFRLGVGGAALAAIGAYGSGFGFWPFTIGFLILGVGIIAALLALIAGIIALIRNRKAGGPGGKAWIGIVAALSLFGIMGYWINRGANAPMIHDVTTNSAAPPVFTTLPMRKDNLVGVGSVEKWRALHDAAYADIRPVSLAKAPAEALGIAKRLVEARGWTIAASGADRIEATAVDSPFGFQDDVIILATPENEGRTTRIDIRSTSRVGVGDLGVNAERVRDFLADLKAADGKTP